MIDPKNITNYNLSSDELEEHLLFWILAAGKNGHTAAKSLSKLMKILILFSKSPLDAVRKHCILEKRRSNLSLPLLLKKCGVGCYNIKAKTMHDLAIAKIKGLDLRKCTTEELEVIKGIGRKTARCFIIHSRKNAMYAGLDTHVLKFLKEKGVDNVPKSTPNSKSDYERLENAFLDLVDKSGKTVAEFDLEVWNNYSIKNNKRSVYI